MTLKESIKTCVFEKYATFSGRASRSEFWWFHIAYSILCAIFWGLYYYWYYTPLLVNLLCVILGLLVVALFLPDLAVLKRRLRDAGVPRLFTFALILGSLELIISILVLGLLEFVELELHQLLALQVICGIVEWVGRIFGIILFIFLVRPKWEDSWVFGNK